MDTVIGKVNATNQVVKTFPTLFDSAWLDSLVEDQRESDNEMTSLARSSASEQLYYRQLLLCVDGYYKWEAMNAKRPTTTM